MKWRKVYSHDITGGLFRNLIEAGRKNVDDEDAALFSILYDLDMMKDDGGLFHFKLCYLEQTDHRFPCNEWKQSSNPILASNVTGFVSISLTWPSRSDGQPFGGLLRSNPGQNLMDDDPGQGWWNSVGTVQGYRGGIPGPRNISVTKKELYVYTGV